MDDSVVFPEPDTPVNGPMFTGSVPSAAEADTTAFEIDTTAVIVPTGSRPGSVHAESAYQPGPSVVSSSGTDELATATAGDIVWMPADAPAIAEALPSSSAPTVSSSSPVFPPEAPRERSPWAPPATSTSVADPDASWGCDESGSVSPLIPSGAAMPIAETPHRPYGGATHTAPRASDAAATVTAGAVPGEPGSPKAPTKRFWVKPALAGGMVGAIVSSAVLGTALVATRNDNTKSTQVASAVTAPAVPGATGVQTLPTDGVPGVLAKIQPSVVTINTKGFDQNFGAFSVEPQQGAGTGIILTADGYILTNAHVIANAASIKVAFPGDKGRKIMSANVVGRDPQNDVAVVKIDGVKDLVPAKLGSSAAMRVGEMVIAVGNALALPGGSTVTTGIVSAIDRTIEGDGEKLTGLLQTDAAINPGNSGGPLVNTSGEVIGMNTAIIQNSNNIGFAIAIDRIKPIVERIKKGESATKPRTFLGVSTQTMDSSIRDQYGLATATGALVVDVTIGSPADNLGLQAGDIITKFDGKDVTTNKLLSDTVQKKKVGDEVEVEWLRGTRKMKGTAVLGSARTLQTG